MESPDAVANDGADGPTPVATTEPDELVTAVTTVHHDRLHPSRVTLPIIDRG